MAPPAARSAKEPTGLGVYQRRRLPPSWRQLQISPAGESAHKMRCSRTSHTGLSPQRFCASTTNLTSAAALISGCPPAAQAAWRATRKLRNDEVIVDAERPL